MAAAIESTLNKIQIVEPADYNVAKALKDHARRAAIVLDAAARTELTQEAMMQASHALSDLASVARILQETIATNLDGSNPRSSSLEDSRNGSSRSEGRANGEAVYEKHGSDSPTEAASAISTVVYPSQSQRRSHSQPRGSRVLQAPASRRPHSGPSRPSPQNSAGVPRLGSAAQMKEVELIQKALGSSFVTSPDSGSAKDPGFIDPDRARYANARSGTLRAAQRVTGPLTSRELSLVKKQSKAAENCSPAEVPLPDQESSVDEEDAANMDDFISVASEGPPTSDMEVRADIFPEDAEWLIATAIPDAWLHTSTCSVFSFALKSGIWTPDSPSTKAKLSFGRGYLCLEASASVLCHRY